jgi:hypothetical protein
VDERDPAVELRVPGEPFFDAGHADQDHADAAAVVMVAELLQGCGLEATGFCGRPSGQDLPSDNHEARPRLAMTESDRVPGRNATSLLPNGPIGAGHWSIARLIDNAQIDQVRRDRA